MSALSGHGSGSGSESGHSLSPLFTFDARLSSRAFDVSFTLERGATLAVLGPNGAGKSTLLNLVSGLLTPTSGHSELGGETLFSIGAGRTVIRPPHTRGVAMLAQDALLFPHLSVLSNVAFGPASTGAGRKEALQTARKWLAEVDALEFVDRRPSQLSGGQSQKIAVARALAAEPRLLLLDEPMAALDIAVAPTLRQMLRRVLENRTAIIVSHDILDAFTLADRVIVIDRGRIVEDGPTRSVLEQPRDPFTASIAGLNIISGTRTSDGIRTVDGNSIACHAALPPGTAVTAAIRPSSIRVSTTRPVGSPNALQVLIQDIEPRGDLVRLRARMQPGSTAPASTAPPTSSAPPTSTAPAAGTAHAGQVELTADVRPSTIADLDVSIGSPLWFAFDPQDATLYSTSR